MKTLEKDVCIINFEHILYLFVVFFIVDFEQVNVSWVVVLNHSTSFKLNLTKNVEAI